MIAVLAMAMAATGAAGPGDGAMRAVPAGRYVPLYGDGVAVDVEGFSMDAYPVTQAEFLRFVEARPRWRRSRAPELLAGEGYLGDWAGDTELGEGPEAPLPAAPVTRVSWFAARGYCAWRGKRLPTLDEWELAGLASETEADGTADPDFHERILAWYSAPQPSHLPPVGGRAANVHGLHDLHGLVWEWVEDWSSVFVTGESRADGSVDRGLFCGAGAAGSNDARNYAAFLRYAMRASLQADYAVRNLGFRCARDAS